MRHSVNEGRGRPTPTPLLVVMTTYCSFLRIVHANDSEAHAYIEAHCGEQAAKAYRCFVAGANRADLYRFCRLFVQGGLYLDGDLVALVPFEQVIPHPSSYPSNRSRLIKSTPPLVVLTLQRPNAGLRSISTEQ